ncbi:MAG: penicillin-insensitive murein endopeptidase [Methylomicrobium sp.]
MKKISPFLVVLALLSPLSLPAETNRWAKVTTSAEISPLAESIGSYTAGCLSGAVELPPNGIGYQVMRLSRHRYYGHPDLKNFIETLGRSVASQHLGVLLIGDMGQPRGGPTLTGHRSHQNGLDVDIWFLLSRQAETRTLAYTERENWSAPSVLRDHSDLIDSRQWTEANERILQLTAEMPEVDRLFVNASIKRELCRTHAGQKWLRKIRPWWKHDDHFHIRLKCPMNSRFCEPQETLPVGDGCDASLAWWFTAEAKSPVNKLPPPKAPVLPARCDQVLYR